MRAILAALMGLALGVPAAHAGRVPGVWQLLGAASLGDVDAEISLSDAYADGEAIKPDAVAAYQWMLRAAKQGSALAQTDVGDMLLWGRGHPVDGALAVVWFVTAAQQGYAPADARLGDVYFYGLNGYASWAQAIAPYRIAAAKHIASAEINLARIYQCTCSLGDQAQALDLLRDAASHGTALAFTRLGEAYYSGLGVAIDDAAGLSWFRKAADQNEPEALYWMGQSYENGWGVERDTGQALAFYLKATDGGNALAAYRAGIFYNSGIGIPRDWKQAEQLWRAAALAGLPQAEEALGRLYFDTVPPGHTRAEGVLWLERAGADGMGTAYVYLAQAFDMLRDPERAYGYAWHASRSRDRQAAQDGAVLMQQIMSTMRRLGLEPPAHDPSGSMPIG